jgi:hypothetical protein
MSRSLHFLIKQSGTHKTHYISNKTTKLIKLAKFKKPFESGYYLSCLVMFRLFALKLTQNKLTFKFILDLDSAGLPFGSNICSVFKLLYELN